MVFGGTIVAKREQKKLILQCLIEKLKVANVDGFWNVQYSMLSTDSVTKGV